MFVKFRERIAAYCFYKKISVLIISFNKVVDIKNYREYNLKKMADAAPPARRWCFVIVFRVLPELIYY